MRKKVKAGRPPAERGIFIADDDRVRLEALLLHAAGQPTPREGYLAPLAGELRRAQVVARAELPPDVVTMGSTVRLRDLETGENETYTLVYPDEVAAVTAAAARCRRLVRSRLTRRRHRRRRAVAG